MPFPARAGMNRFFGVGSFRSVAVPRARGDEPVVFIGEASGVARSPRARG